MLLNRNKRHVELTEAGALFLEQARQALEHLDLAGEVVRQAALGIAGELHIAFTASVPLVEAFPKLVQAFRSEHPLARVEAVLPAWHPLAAQDAPLPMTALADESFVLFSRGIGCGLFEHVTVLTSRAGFAPHLIQEAREGATIIGLVAAGMGISVLPDIYARTGIPGVVYRQLETPDTDNRLLLAYRRDDQNPLLRRFLDTVNVKVAKTQALVGIDQA